MKLAGERPGPLLVVGKFRVLRSLAMALVLTGAVACTEQETSGEEREAPRTKGGVPLAAGLPFEGERPGRSSGEEVRAQAAAPEQDEARQGPMIVRKAELTVRVDDVAKAAEALETRAKAIGGYVAGSTLDRSGTAPSGHLELRVPAPKLDEFLGGISRIGTVLRHTVSAEDVGMEFHDLEAQLRNWRAEERRLQELFARAAKVPDLLQVERELARVRGQIDQATGRRDFLANQVAYATVTLDLSQPSAPHTPPGWNALGVLREAGSALWETTLGLVTLGIWIAVFSPLWIPGWLLGRWLWSRRMRKATKAA